MKNNKNNKIKRVLSAILASVMLLGLSVTANAESTGAGTNACTHVYIQSRAYYNSYAVEPHPYAITVIYEDGSVGKEYRTCSRVIYFYHYRYQCVFCNDTFVSEAGGQEIRHMNCGAPNE